MIIYFSDELRWASMLESAATRDARPYVAVDYRPAVRAVTRRPGCRVRISKINDPLVGQSGRPPISEFEDRAPPAPQGAD